MLTLSSQQQTLSTELLPFPNATWITLAMFFTMLVALKLTSMFAVAH